MDKSHKDKIYILIELFIKKPVNIPPDQFKKEMVAAARLIKRYSNFDFFYTLPELTDNFNSLFGLLGKYWLPKLDIKYKEFIKNKKFDIVLEENPVIDIDIIPNFPKTILEFLKS